jgi:hypothetical protein
MAIQPPFQSLFVGVLDQKSITPVEIKRWALMFDVLAVNNLELVIQDAYRHSTQLAAELEFIAQNGLLKDSLWGKIGGLERDSPERRVLEDTHFKEWERFVEEVRLFNRNPKPPRPATIDIKEDFVQAMRAELSSVLDPVDPPEYIEAWNKALGITDDADVGTQRPEPVLPKTFELHATHIAALRLRQLGIDAVPVNPTLPNIGPRASVALSVLVRSFPQPAQDTPWENILALKSDPQTSEKFVRLRRWIQDIAKTNVSADELEDKVSWLLYDYGNHMRVYEAKICRNALDTLIVSTAEFVEDVVKLRLSKLAKGLLSVSARQAEIDAVELKAAGRELAYISHIAKELRVDETGP